MRRGILTLLLAVALVFEGVIGLAWAEDAVTQLRKRNEDRIGGGPVMNDGQAKAVELLRQRDEEFFLFNDQRAVELQAKLASMLRQKPLSRSPTAAGREVSPVLAVGAPAVVKLDQHPDVPVLVATRQTGQREWEVKYDQNALVVAVDLQSGIVRSSRQFSKNKLEMTHEPSRTGPPPDVINATAVNTSVRRFYLGEVCDTEWRPAKLAVTVIVYDWISNTVVTTLEKSGEEPQQISPRNPSDFIRESSAKALTPRVTDSGSALSVPNNVSAHAAILIRGTVELGPDRVAVAPSSKPGKAPLLLASLLLLKLDESRPVQVDLAVPALVQTPFLRRAVVKAAFDFDLRVAVGSRPLSGKYQIYFVVGDTITGPYPMNVEAG
jgi:hypothetical protein